MKRLLFFPFLVLFAIVETGCTQSEASVPEVIVYKSPTCGCCTKWVDHMRQAGFEVTAEDVDDVTVYKKKFGLPAGLGSCHTAVVDGYVVEGHVPAEEVKRMLEEKPDVLGIAVPGMPIGSPGMEQGDQIDSYEIVTFDQEGHTTVYATR